MKKSLLVLLILIFALTGCGKKEGEQEFVFKYVEDDTSDVATTTDTEQETVAEIGGIGDIVDAQYSNSGTIDIPYDENNKDTVEFSFNIPRIKDSSDAAKKINAEIYDKAKGSIELVESILDGTAEEVYEPSYVAIDYDAYMNGDIISIVIRSDVGSIEWRDYDVYNYNVTTHELANNDEIFETAGTNKDEFIANAKKTFGAIALPDIEQYFDDDADDNAEDSEQSEEEIPAEDRYRIIADFMSSYAQTVSERNINKDMPVYIDGEGKIGAVCLVSVPAGAGQYYHAERVEDKSNNEIIKKYCEYVEKYHYEGFEKDCLALYAQEGLSGSIVRKITVSKMSSEEVYIGFDSEDVSVFTMQFYGSDYSDVYLGTLAFDGLDENGILFSYELTEKNGEKLEGEEVQPISGRFYLNAYSYYDEKEEDMISGAIYKFMDGEDMLASDGHNVIFTKTYG